MGSRKRLAAVSLACRSLKIGVLYTMKILLTRTRLLLLCLWIQAGGMAQESYFTAFAINPAKTPDSLTIKWNDAASPQAKFNAVTALCRFHESTGLYDSVLYYGELFNRQVGDMDIPPSDRDAYTATVNLFIGNAYKNKGLPDEAMRYYLRNVEQLESSDDPVLIKSRIGMTDVYYYKNDSARASASYDALLKDRRIDEDSRHHILFQLGNMNMERDSLEPAADFFETAMNYYAETGQTKKALAAKLNLGIVAEKRGSADSAYMYYEQVKDEAREHNHYDLYIAAGQNIADLMIKEKEYKSAEMLLAMVYANTMQWNIPEAQLRVLSSLEKVFLAQKDYQNAYGIMTQYVGVSKEMAALQNKKEVSELEIKYETAQKEKELLLKEQQISKQRGFKYMILAGFVVTLIPVMGLLYVYYQKLQTQSRLNATLEEASQHRISHMLQEKELELLKASVEGELKERSRVSRELHDSIGGSLAAIKMRLSEPGADITDILSRVDQTYQQVREISHNLASPHFANSVFTEVLRGYLDNFQKPGLTISLNAYPEEAINQLPIHIKAELYKIVQELTTNSLKYAHASTIDVQITEVDEYVKLMFEDNGAGFNPDQPSSGLGLINIRNRVEALSGSLVIDSKKGRGTIFDVEVPLNNTKHEV